MIPMQPTPTPPAHSAATAVRIAPRRDPVTGRTVCYVQPGADGDSVDLFSATLQFCGSAPAADWPEGSPAPVDPVVEARRAHLQEVASDQPAAATADPTE